MKQNMRACQLIPILLLLVACAGPPAAPTLATASSVTVSTSTPVILPSPTARSVAPTTVPMPAAQPVSPTRTAAAPVQAALWAKWQSGPHGNTFDLGKGPNTYCSRCHSPQNWDPTSKIDAPPNCVSCKFETDTTVRVAKSNPLVDQADWRNIGCDVCHRVENGIASAEIAWFNQVTGQYEPVANTTSLCEKCHMDTDVLRHRRDLGKAAHVGFQCTQCHDAHTTKASCASSQCHASLSQIPGHDAVHATVNCVACHDASGLQVGRDPIRNAWITWRTTELLGRKTTKSYVTHDLQKTVDCARCHFAGNPWNLSDSVRKTP